MNEIIIQIGFGIIVILLSYICAKDISNHFKQVNDSAKAMYLARLEKESKKKDDDEWIAVTEDNEETEENEDNEEEDSGILFME